ncbi:MAG TPA: hypothetical protein VMF86_13795 [Stellaceae bacterium]|nr:hypothetical protein [Stellaceae bacterium]
MYAVNPSDPCGDALRRAAREALSDAVDWAYGGVSLSRSRCRSRLVGAGLPADLYEALADPIVEALMAADGTDREGVETLMRRMAARLDGRNLGTLRDGAKNGA